MKHADLQSAQAPAQGPAEIHLDRDAMSTRGWLSRRGRRLLDGPGHLLSEADAWFERHSAQPGLPRQGIAGQSC